MTSQEHRRAEDVAVPADDPIDEVNAGMVAAAGDALPGDTPPEAYADPGTGPGDEGGSTRRDHTPSTDEVAHPG